ncbi:MAG: EAL domain-containing protein [Steroidobacteraceae bacterium]|jgi:diguanylate cyclase (GGDEF)-like protein/PAS domain S-box-containing protein
MSIIALLCLLFGVAALLLLVLYFLQRRQLGALEEVSRQVQRTAIGGSLKTRIELHTDQPELAALVTAVNHLIARAALAADQVPPLGAPIGALGDRLHEAVLIHASGIRYANPQFAGLLGRSVEELLGHRLDEFVLPEYAELVANNLRRRLASEETAERYEVELTAVQGQGARLELSTWPIEHQGERALLILGVEVLPTQTVEALQPPERRSRARLTLDSLSEALVTTDQDGHVEYLNAAAARLLGLDSSAAAGKPIEELARVVEENDRKLLGEPVRQALSSGAPLNIARRPLLVRAATGERLIELSAAPIRMDTGESVGAVVLLHDVTEIRGLARQISYQATHDALTGLINRREFEHRLQEALDTAHRGDSTHVLCYLDLDRFKSVNDSSGHVAGDAMLREIAKILRDAVRDSDTVARIGGDEFGMLLVGCPLDKARQIADDVCRSVRDYNFVWKDKIFSVGVSLGLVELARDSGSIEEALAAADSACYVAKRQGSHVAIYSARDEIFARETGEIHWLQTLQIALRDNRFELYCQRIVASYPSNDEGPAMEVLVRLRNDLGEQLVPLEFLRAAERYRLIGLIDRWVVQTTLTALGRGAIALDAKRSIAINISGQTLADGQFLEFVVECLDSTGANPAQICFEIAESTVVANFEQARRFVGVLHGMGCRFALDDFGSGIGSFANLKNLAVDYLKIDGSFFKNLARDTVNQAMVSAMIRLARTLNFKVIAEQIEDASAMDAARQIGVDYLQGFAIGRPERLPIAA